MMALGAAQFENGDKKEARVTFMRLLTWRSDYKVDLNQLSAGAAVEPFEDVRKEVERAKRGVARDPLRAAGGAGLRRRALRRRDADLRRRAAVGEHWVTLQERGLQEGGHGGAGVVEGAAAGERAARALERSTSWWSRRWTAWRRRSARRRSTTSADNLKEVLFVDHAVFVRAKPAPGGMIEVDSFLYDLRTRERLTRVTKTVPAAQRGEAAAVAGVGALPQRQLRGRAGRVPRTRRRPSRTCARRSTRPGGSGPRRAWRWPAWCWARRWRPSPRTAARPTSASASSTSSPRDRSLRRARAGRSGWR